MLSQARNVTRRSTKVGNHGAAERATDVAMNCGHVFVFVLSGVTAGMLRIATQMSKLL